MSQYSGIYILEEPTIAKLEQMMNAVAVKMPAYLVITIAGGVQRVNFQDSSGNLGIFLFWGLSTENIGNIIYASNGIDDASSGNAPIIQIRGQFLSKDALDFCYFNSITGLYGVFRARRVDALSIPTQIMYDLPKLSRSRK
jgi:hypothetical protein